MICRHADQQLVGQQETDDEWPRAVRVARRDMRLRCCFIFFDDIDGDGARDARESRPFYDSARVMLLFQRK